MRNQHGYNAPAGQWRQLPSSGSPSGRPLPIPLAGPCRERRCLPTAAIATCRPAPGLPAFHPSPSPDPLAGMSASEHLPRSAERPVWPESRQHLAVPSPTYRPAQRLRAGITPNGAPHSPPPYGALTLNAKSTSHLSLRAVCTPPEVNRPEISPPAIEKSAIFRTPNTCSVPFGLSRAVCTRSTL